jgi:hypothetical protein
MTTSSIDPANVRLRAWDVLDERAQRSVADEIAARIGGRVLGLFEHESGSLRHRVATIERDGVELGFIPGGPVHLGWSSDAPLSLSEERLARWREQGEVDLTFTAFIAPTLTPARVVELAPFLIELAPKSIADWVGDLDDGEPLAAIAARVRRDGFRLPTDDEWEHAVRAGGTTFFRTRTAMDPAARSAALAAT